MLQMDYSPRYKIYEGEGRYAVWLKDGSLYGIYNSQEEAQAVADNLHHASFDCVAAFPNKDEW